MGSSENQTTVSKFITETHCIKVMKKETCFDPGHRVVDSNPGIRLNDVEITSMIHLG